MNSIRPGRNLVLALAFSLFGLPAVQGAVVTTLNNLSDSISVDASRADWAGVTAYPSDSAADGSDLDYSSVSMANNSGASTLFIRAILNSRITVFGFRDSIYIDTDLNRGTGFIGGGGQFALGADYLIQGASIFQFIGGTQTTFAWNSLGSATYNDDGGTGLDIEMSIPLATIGSPETFNFILLGDNATTPDYYPNNANGGAGGDVFQYSTITPVPEPGSLALLGFGLAAVGMVRKRGNRQAV